MLGAGKSRVSPWLTVLIFLAIAEFNPEVLTGSTHFEGYFTFGNLLGLLFYGLQVAVIADLAARYRFGWRSIYLVGLIYGILEEGFAVMTMERQGGPAPGSFRVIGLNVLWVPYISVFHAVVSVIATIIIVKIIWPDRVSASFLRRRHYFVIIPVTAAVYLALIYYVLNIYTPGPAPFLVLALLVVLLALLARRVREAPNPRIRTNRREYLKLAVPLMAVSSILIYVLAQIAGADAIALLILIGIACLFYLLFRRMDQDVSLDDGKLLALFTVFVGTWLVVGALFRTPLSNVAAVVGVALQLYFGHRAIRRRLSSKAREGNRF